MAEYTNFNDITPQDLLRLVTIRIKAKKGKEDLTLVHEDKVYITDKDEIEQRTVRVLVKADKEVPLGLAKIVNVAKDLTKTEERNFDIEGEDELYDLNYPTCVKASDEIDLSIYALNNLSDALSFPIFNAKKVYLKPNGGKFKKDTTLWTAPSGNGVLDADLIFEDVILHDNKNGKKDKDIEIKNFTKIRYSSSSSGCGAKITLSTGESIIYNADKNTTMMKDGSSTMLLKKPFMYMYEYSEGWCSINFESFSKMMFGGVNSMFGKEKRKEFVQGMVGLANEIGRHSPKAAQEIHKSLKEGAGTKITGSQIILPDGDIITSPQNIKEEFDFYRLPNALNKMLSLKRLRKALKFRRIGEYKGKKYVATPDDVYIKLSRKPCKTEKGKCNFALFGEKNGEKIKIFYNKGNLISTITVEDVVMTFDYGVYDVEGVPLRVSSCFDKN